ncbi:putative glycosyltransferase [Halomicronema hongdechloris C2206]|uniref:Glycosyltransferase n=2 Tax=Halomicronema hongdechloris TaxID=1209493 RepID=A0A1Z3HSD1_9CYAN|nr:glycosyltransferase family 2 protein [Halomicronema hongdechloris]ASC73176.1 putative glycosyltransferase [Halomicronema hongdechloris C2206]
MKTVNHTSKEVSQSHSKGISYEDMEHGKYSDVAPYDLSLVIPIYNEIDSIPKLLQRITTVFEKSRLSYEIICVDDGSVDGSASFLIEQAKVRSDLRVIALRRNYGQTPAMAAGFEHARGRAIVTLDGDLQNDPADIPTLLSKLSEGYDLVSGWRKNRQDAALTRLLPSKIANWLIGRITGVKLHDYGCSLKVYRSELIADIRLYGEMHRFLPAIAFTEGARIAEVPVRHHARKFGHSKYGLGRTLRVLADLLTVSFMQTFLTKPMHAFGFAGLFSIFLGVILASYLAFLKIFLDQGIGDRPLLLLAVVLFLAGIQMFSFGLLADLLMRTYHESQNRPVYRIRQLAGFRK